MPERNPFPSLDPDLGGCGPINCPECGSCGEPGCCGPFRCNLVRCRYGQAGLDEYRRAREEASRWYSCLLELGIADPFSLTEETAAAIQRERTGQGSPPGTLEACLALLDAMEWAGIEGYVPDDQDPEDGSSFARLWQDALEAGKAAVARSREDRKYDA